MRDGILIIDKRSIDSRIVRSDSAEGFAAAFAQSNGMLSFEIRIPLHIEQYFSKYTSPLDRGMILVGIGIGGSTGRGFSGNTPGAGGGSMGRMGGGRRRGIYSQPSSNDASDLWIEIALAKPS